MNLDHNAGDPNYRKFGYELDLELWNAQPECRRVFGVAA